MNNCKTVGGESLCQVPRGAYDYDFSKMMLSDEGAVDNDAYEDDEDFDDLCENTQYPF
jgi:hypothetical protein